VNQRSVFTPATRVRGSRPPIIPPREAACGQIQVFGGYSPRCYEHMWRSQGAKISRRSTMPSRKTTNTTKHKAVQLRHEPTPAERKLWAWKPSSQCRLIRRYLRFAQTFYPTGTVSPTGERVKSPLPTGTSFQKRIGWKRVRVRYYPGSVIKYYQVLRHG
jgi:hypothetical protein